MRQALVDCPDEFPAATTSELAFIIDKELREGLRLDIGAVERAFANLEWKAATVLAGSAIEALLFWVLDTRLSDKIPDSASRVFQSKPKGTLENWTLYHYVEIAADLQVVEADTAKLVRLAKDYRNLIHPARES